MALAPVLLILWLIAELFVVIKVAGAIGVLATIVLLIASWPIGTWALRTQGAAAWAAADGRGRARDERPRARSSTARSCWPAAVLLIDARLHHRCGRDPAAGADPRADAPAACAQRSTPAVSMRAAGFSSGRDLRRRLHRERHRPASAALVTGGRRGSDPDARVRRSRRGRLGLRPGSAQSRGSRSEARRRARAVLGGPGVDQRLAAGRGVDARWRRRRADGLAGQRARELPGARRIRSALPYPRPARDRRHRARPRRARPSRQPRRARPRALRVAPRRERVVSDRRRFRADVAASAACKGHDRDVVVASVFEPAGAAPVADPRLSTTYAADGSPARRRARAVARSGRLRRAVPAPRRR